MRVTRLVLPMVVASLAAMPAVVAAPAAASRALGWTKALNGTYSGVFPHGIGTVELTIRGGRLTAFVAPKVTQHDAVCPNISTALDLAGGPDWGKGQIEPYPRAVVQANGRFDGNLEWRGPPASGTGMTVGWSGRFTSPTAATLSLSMNWTYIDRSSGGLLSQCYTGRRRGTIRKLG